VAVCGKDEIKEKVEKNFSNSPEKFSIP
jgi:hypothetical protein